MFAYFQCHPQLGADTVRPGDEQAVLVPARSLEIENRTKPTDRSIRARAAGLLDKRLDFLDKLVARINGDASVRVREPLAGCTSRGGVESTNDPVSTCRE